MALDLQHRKSHHQSQLSHYSLAIQNKNRANRNYTPLRSILTANLYHFQSSRYLSCFLIHSSLCISRIAFRSAVDCYRVSNPSGVTPRPHHKHTCVSKVPTLTQSADSVICVINQQYITNNCHQKTYCRSQDWKLLLHSLQPSSSVAR